MDQLPPSPDDAPTPDDGGAAVGPAAAAGPPGPPAGSPRRRRRVVAVGVVALLCVAAGAVVLVQAWRGDGDPAPWAEAWDPRIVELVAFVEGEQAARFDHPVEVVFLADADFRAEVTDDGTGPSDEDRLELERLAAQFRALGLVSGPVDLFEGSDRLMGEGVLGFYSHDRRRIVVRGEELGPATRATLVHELTHALQDQRYGIEAVFDAAGDDGALLARALVEGDARLVEQAYRAGLGEPDQAEVDGGAEPDLEGVPEVLVVLLAAPYELGAPLVTFVEERGGREAVDALFADPPTSEIALFDPRRALGDDERREVAVPAAPEGAEVVDEGGFGPFAWYLALAARTDPTEALRILDGWAGDAYVAYERDGRVCVAVAFEAVDDEAATASARGLDAWVARAGGEAEATHEARRSELRSCDPGGEARAEEPPDLLGAMLPVLVRAQVLADLAAGVDGAFEDDQLWCFATTLLDELRVEQLTGTAVAPEVVATVRGVQERCGLGG